MIRRLLAIVFIFICTTTAWMILSITIAARTYDSQPGLRDKVASSWGTPQVQTPPAFTWNESPLAVESSKIDAGLDLEYRQKGLLWYSTYKVAFAGVYEIRNESETDREVRLRWAFPAQKAIYDDFSVSLDDHPLAVDNRGGIVTGGALLPAGRSGLVRISYRSQGMDQWTYSLGVEAAQVRNFHLQLTTNFRGIDFPDNALSPSVRSETPNGWRLSWDYRKHPVNPSGG